jgi:hypothetical protein
LVARTVFQKVEMSVWTTAVSRVVTSVARMAGVRDIRTVASMAERLVCRMVESWE